MKKLGISLLGIIFIFVLVACGEAEGSDEITTLYIAHALDESTENTGAANEWFRQELENYLGIEVVQVEEISHLAGVEAMRAGHLDMMFASSFNVVSAMEVVDVEIAGTLNHSQVQPLYALFITNNDDIQSMDELEGHSFAFVDAASGTGFFIPGFYLVERFGLNPDRLLESGYFFSATAWSGSHNTSILGTSLGDYDASAVIATVFANAVTSGLIEEDAIRVIGQTPPVPDSSYIMRADLPDELRDQIRSFFLQLDHPEYYRDAWGIEELRFVEPNYDALGEIRRMQDMLWQSE